MIFLNRLKISVFNLIMSYHLINDEIRIKQYFRFIKDEFHSFLDENTIQDVDALKSQPSMGPLLQYH